MSKIFEKGAVVWIVMLIAAILNGLFREQFITPVLGDFAARALSSVILSVLILRITVAFIPWFRISKVPELWILGAFWTIITITLEFLFGRIQGFSWQTLISHYNFLEGRLWILVPVTTLVSPRIAAKIRKSI
jgi:hypothetical protein